MFSCFFAVRSWRTVSTVRLIQQLVLPNQRLPQTNNEGEWTVRYVHCPFAYLACRCTSLPSTQWILGRKDASISEECGFWACHSDVGEDSRSLVYWQSVSSVSEDLATSVFGNKQPVRSVSRARRLIRWRRHGLRRTLGAGDFHTCGILSLFWVYGDWIYFWQKIQSVPLATEPGISLIILPLMRILQRNLKRTYLIV
jgi:hypothetical protein